jgi:hypothetical protein
MDPDRQSAVNDAIAEVTRKWFGFAQLPRDKDVTQDARDMLRVTAFVRNDERWRRCELVLSRRAVEHVVLQPFPQGRPVIFQSPFLLIDGGPTHSGDGTVHDVELVMAERTLSMRLDVEDLDLLTKALAAK